MQGVQLSDNHRSDSEVQEARVSADMAARVAAVTALSQLAQVASHQQQLPDKASDAQYAGTMSASSLAYIQQPSLQKRKP